MYVICQMQTTDKATTKQRTQWQDSKAQHALTTALDKKIKKVKKWFILLAKICGIKCAEWTVLSSSRLEPVVMVNDALVSTTSQLLVRPFCCRIFIWTRQTVLKLQILLLVCYFYLHLSCVYNVPFTSCRIVCYRIWQGCSLVLVSVSRWSRDLFS